MYFLCIYLFICIDELDQCSTVLTLPNPQILLVCALHFSLKGQLEMRLNFQFCCICYTKVLNYLPITFHMQ